MPARKPSAPAQVVLELFVSGPTPRSALAIVNVRRLCEQYLNGRYHLEIIDLSRFPALAALHQIIAAPTLLRRLPLPERRFIGDLSKAESLMAGMGIAGQA